MPVYKDKNGTWYVMTRCDDWQGQRKQKCKRGFKTKREAQDWERRFLLQQCGDLDMLFKDFYKLYEQDMKARLKQNTWEHKACVIKSKILPYFGEKSMKDIQARDVLTWQNELLRHRDKNGKPYSETYLKNLHNQLSCIFNHAVRYYDLSTNPAAKAGSIGVKNAKEMNFWTKDEYMQFSEVMMDKPISFYAFEIHHIFPEAYCKNNGLPKEKWNSIVNKTPLLPASNRSIGGDAPSIYSKRIMKSASIDESELRTRIESNLINYNAFISDDFDSYFIARAKALLTIIEKAMGKTIADRNGEQTIKQFGCSLEE